MGEPMKYIITIAGNNISPRLDMTTEILIADVQAGQVTGKPKTILLNRTGAEDMCDLIIKEGADCLICGGIEERYYKYLNWKKTKVIESVIGSHKEALNLASKKKLQPGAILTTIE